MRCQFVFVVNFCLVVSSWAAPVLLSEWTEGGQGWSDGLTVVEASDKYLVSMTPAETGEGMEVKIWDRPNDTELAVIALDDFLETGSFFWDIALWGNLLGIASLTSDGIDVQFAVYDLESTEFPRLAHREIQLQPAGGFALTASARGWLLGNSVMTRTLGLETGLNIGTWPVPPGKLTSDGHWMFSTIESDRFNGIDTFWLADLEVSGSVVDVRGLDGIEPDYSEFYAWLREDMLILMAVYVDAEENHTPVISGYDPQLGTITWQLFDPSGNWFQAAASSGNLFLPDTQSGGVRVIDMSTGSTTHVIGCPDSAETNFAWFVRTAAGLLFVSGDDRWFVFDIRDNTYLYPVDSGGQPLGPALVQSVPGSTLLAWVFNLNDYVGYIGNGYYWNPQVMLFDPELRQFTRQLDLEDPVVFSGTNFPDPAFFGVRVYENTDGRIGVRSNSLQGIGTKYQLFDPQLLVRELSHSLMASIQFSEPVGWSIELTRESAGEEPEVLHVNPWGRGDTLTLDIPRHMTGTDHHYWVNSEQRVNIVRDYEPLITEIEEMMPDQTLDRLNLAQFAGSLIASTWDNESSSGPGQITIIDSATGAIRFTLGPFSYRFGARVQVAGNILAAGTEGTLTQDSVRVFDLTSGDELLTLPGATAFSLTDEVVVRVVDDELVGNRIFDGTELYRVPVSYSLPYPSARPRLVAGGGVSVLYKRVHDLETGAFLYELTSPNPEPEDNFPSHIVADGNLVVAVASGQSTAYAFNAATGAHVQTFYLEERPDGYINYGSAYPALALDTSDGVFAWAINGSFTEPDINLFDLATGDRFAQVRSPLMTLTFGGDSFETTRERIGDGIALHNGSLWMRTVGYDDTVGTGVTVLDYGSIRQATLTRASNEVVPEFSIRLRWLGQRDKVYRLETGTTLDDFHSDGVPINGSGDWQEVRFPVPEGSGRRFGRISVDWAAKD